MCKTIKPLPLCVGPVAMQETQTLCDGVCIHYMSKHSHESAPGLCTIPIS